MRSDEETETPSDAVEYQESDDSSSSSSDDGTDGGTSHDGVQGQQDTCQPLEFTCEKTFTHATQDEDHGCHESRIIKKTYTRAKDRQRDHPQPQDSSSYASYGSSTSLPTYQRRDANLLSSADDSHSSSDISYPPNARFVYQWVEPVYYQQIYTHWLQHVHPTYNWEQYKVHLAHNEGLVLIDNNEYIAQPSRFSTMYWYELILH